MNLHTSSIEKYTDAKKINETETQTSQKTEFPEKNLTYMNGKGTTKNVKKGNSRSVSCHHSPEEQKKKVKLNWESSGETNSNFDCSSTTESTSPWFGLPQHHLVSGLIDDCYENNWVQYSETSSISVQVRPRRCERHVCCQDSACQASRIGTPPHQTVNGMSQQSSTSPFTARNGSSTTVHSSDWLEFEDFLAPLVHSQANIYCETTCPTIPNTRSALGTVEEGTKQPAYFGIVNVPETLASLKHKITADSDSQPKGFTDTITSESAVPPPSVSFNDKCINAEIVSEGTNISAHNIVENQQVSRPNRIYDIFSNDDSDVNEGVYAAAEQLIQNYSPICEIIDLDLPEDFEDSKEIFEVIEE